MKMRISNSAKTEVLRASTLSGLSDPIPAVLWAHESDSKPGVWVIGFYERSRVDEISIVAIDGVEFVIELNFRDCLNGGVIEHYDEHFQVEGARNFS